MAFSRASPPIWPCADGDPRRGDDRLNLVGDVVDVVNAVVDEIDLAVAVQLAMDRRAWIVSSSNRRMRVSIALRSGGGVSRFEMSRMPRRLRCKRARDRRGREGEDVDRRAERLQPLLVLDAEPLLLVDHDQPKLLEGRRPSAQCRCVPIRMSTPPAAVRFRTSLISDLGRNRLTTSIVKGKLGHPLREAAMVLLGEDGRRHEHGDLLAGVDRLERRAHRDLGFAVADVAANQPVHRPGLGHVALHGLDGRELVGRLLVGKRGLELGHPVRVSSADTRSPAGWRGAAWMSISSAARSTTASATRALRFSQADEPIFERGGSARPPPTYFCTRSILAIGTYSFVPSANSRSSVSSSCPPSRSTQMQAAITRDPVVHVDDEIAFVEVEEAIDRPALVAPAGRPAGGCRRARTARDRRSRACARRSCGSPARMRPTVSASRPACASSVSPKTSPSRSTSPALWQAINTRSPAAALSSSAFTFVSSPREPLDALDAQVAGRFERTCGDRRQRDRGKLQEPRERRFDGEQPARIGDAGEILPAFLAEVVRLDEHDPGVAREGVDEVAELQACRSPESPVSVDRFPALQRALGFRVEGADRFDLVAEEFESYRLGGVERKDVENAAAHGELAGDLDHFGAHHPAFSEPGGQVLDGHGIADVDDARTRRERGGRRHPLQERLKRRDDDLRRQLSLTAASRCARAGRTLRRWFRSGSRAGNTSGLRPENVARSSRKSSTSATCASATSNVEGGVQRQRGGGERPRRTPRAVERRAMTVLERREDLGKSRGALHQPGQVVKTFHVTQGFIGASDLGHGRVSHRKSSGWLSPPSFTTVNWMAKSARTAARRCNAGLRSNVLPHRPDRSLGVDLDS